MDKYKDTIHTFTYSLHVLDSPACVANIPFIYYFKGPISTDVLSDSFYKTVCFDFPILLGRLKENRKGYAQINVNKDNLNEPDYQESSSSMHFEDLENANFSWAAMPKDLVTVSLSPTAGKDGVIKLANVHVISLKDNSGIVLFVSIPHYAMDGNGYSQFMLRWSQTFKQMDSPGVVNYCHDRILLEETMDPVDAQEVDSATRAVYTYRTCLSRWLAWMSPETRGPLLRFASEFASISSHVFSIPVSKIRDHGMALSDNDMLTALVSLVLSQCFDDPDKKCTLVMAVDVRYRLGNSVIVDKRYTGNCLIGRALQFTAQSGKSNVELAHKIRATVNNTGPSFVAGFIDMLKDDPSCFTNPIAYGINHPNSILWSNQSRFPLYDCDFGGNAPKWISPVSNSSKTFVSVLPKKKQRGIPHLR